MDAGVYVVVFRLARARRLRVGLLGPLAFPAGYYFYAGSAQRNLAARIARHGRRRKPKHWHIDYLSAHAPMVAALAGAGPKAAECRLANALGRLCTPLLDGFGCSDCACRTHLFWRPPDGQG
jgi:sugar fermentation stimulation protein A